MCQHPRECLDLLCVADLALWSSFKQPMSMSFYEEAGKPFYKWVDGVQTAYGQSYKKMFAEGSESEGSFTPIGSFLSRLLNKLGLHDERLKDFSRYFGQAVGGGSSLKWRNWPANVLSKEAKLGLLINARSYQKPRFFDEG